MASSYTYCNGVYQVTTYVRNGFKRFHSMNAQCAEFDIDSRWHCWQFVSYNTNICQVMYDSKYDKWHVLFNSDPFDYSRSTSRQVCRWLRENGFSFAPSIVKEAYNNCQPITSDISEYNYDNVTIRFTSTCNVFNRNWR